MGKLNKVLLKIRGLMLEGDLGEAEYNYHVGNINMDKLKPHYSDSITMMQGRDTGHFGSGMYFSTYGLRDKADYDKKYGSYGNYRNQDPNLINVEGAVYRVDFDIYKNLYRVNSNNHGDMLYKTLKSINQIFHSYEYGNRDLGKWFMGIVNNMAHLGLKMPKYREFLRLLEGAKGDFNNIVRGDKASSNASFSTRIMEWNGYNGINVSGLYDWDNTLHGSVIYDINKIGGELRRVNVNSFNRLNKSGIIGDEFGDIKIRMLSDKWLFEEDVEKLNELPLSASLTLVKRYENWFSGSVFDKLRSELKRAYLLTIHKKLLNNEEMVSEIDRFKLQFLIDNNLINIIYDSNIKKGGESLLSMALYDLRFDEEYVVKLIDGIDRELDDNEKESLEIAKEYL